MTRPLPYNPLVAIIGATGTGKSQLAVEIAKRYNGEIINGDAMQLYSGLPVITNKITKEEQDGIPHHLLGQIGLEEETWVVGTFVRNALKTIDEIRARGRLPILVGGTHYYTQSLLFHDRLSDGEEQADSRQYVDDIVTRYPILQSSTEVLLEELTRVDPAMADRWHPNDRRKIQRSLEIYLQTGRRASDIYAEQRARKGPVQSGESTVSDDRPTMRFPTLLLWVHAENKALRKRLDRRVEKMLERGLLHEVETLYNFAEERADTHGVLVDETRGIWVSIGYKEFKQYAQAKVLQHADESQLSAMRDAAVYRAQAATRQYAKRQLRWIRIKLVNALAEARCSGRLYLLDGTDLSSYQETVVQPALALTAQFLQAEDMPPPSSISSAATEMLTPAREYDLSATPEKWVKQHCSVCDITCVTPEQWQAHTSSKKHKKLLSKHRHAEQPADIPADKPPERPP